MRTRVVLCGSFHRDSDGLKRLFRELEINGCRILSPLSIDFIDTRQAIVKAKTESDLEILDLEKFHIRAMRDADLIWLHAPNGHIGLSTAFEIGFATALKKPIFCSTTPQDEMLQTQITVVESVFASLEAISSAVS